MRVVNSAFYERLQSNGQLVELIDLFTRNRSFHWTSANGPITATMSGSAVNYTPFPGGTPSGIEESSDLGVSVIDFVMANTTGLLGEITRGGEFAMSPLVISRVFADTPDLGRMYIFNGQVGDYTRDRQTIVGQSRNLLQGLASRFPLHTYQDTCVWRFGSDGCGFDTSSVTFNLTSLNVASSTTLVLRAMSGAIVQSYSAGALDWGRVTITGGVNSGSVRTIRAQTGDLIGLSHPLPINSFANITLSIYRGCRKRLIEDCRSTFNNDENFLGFPWIPIQENAFV